MPWRVTLSFFLGTDETEQEHTLDEYKQRAPHGAKDILDYRGLSLTKL